MRTKKTTLRILAFILLLTSYFLLPTLSCSEVLDRIAAIVNNEVILQSEYEEALQAARKTEGNVSNDDVLEEMINRILLLEQARRLKLGTSADSGADADDEALVKEYVDRRIRALIHIPIEEIEAYYLKNRDRFGGKDFYEVEDEIENYFIEKGLEEKLLEHIKELRKKAYIRIQLDSG
ncbi:MAG: hypothetical protein HZA14_06375 [Nitrospirae bacterium]|nr:hypothetical protein [Nitrospirota bacterium]